MPRAPTPEPTLKRSLSLPLLTLYGVGTTVGAGIYVLIGKVVGEAIYVQEGPGRRPLTVLVGLLVAAAGLVSPRWRTASSATWPSSSTCRTWSCWWRSSARSV